MNKLILTIFAGMLPILVVAQQDERQTTGNVPIEFYGKVVDQEGTPLAHAEVTLEQTVGHLKSPTEGYESHDKIKLRTDESGAFVLNDTKGMLLHLTSIAKPGYELSKMTERDYSYSIGGNVFHPDANHPRLFVLWDKAKKMPLVTRDKAYDFIPDGRAYAIDLGARRMTEATNSEGDLQFSLTRQDGVRKGDRFDWTFSLKAECGNLFAPVDDDYFEMTFAPNDGYTTEYQMSNQAADQSWKRFGQKEFYVKMHDGHGYAKVALIWDTVATTGSTTSIAGIRIKYTLNPRGLALTQ